MSGPPYPIVLGVHPTVRGFGWTVFQGPSAPCDWGIAYARRDKNAACLRYLRDLLERHRPEFLVLERATASGRQRYARQAQLSLGMAAVAEEFGIELLEYGREDIASVVLGKPSGTRQEIAEAVAGHVAAFSYRLPKARRAWDSVDRRLALFAAAALALTAYARL